MLILLYLIVMLNIIELAFCATNLLAPRSYCGYQHTDDYVRKTSTISIDEFPWIAQLLYDEDKHILCTGSLINHRYILTGAQAFFLGYRPIAVRLGDYDATRNKDCVQNVDDIEECSDPTMEFGIEKIIRHRHYKRISKLNDIGLIRLSTNVEYSEYIRPICLPLSDSLQLIENQELAVSGWGLTSERGQATTIKKKILTKLVSYETCHNIYMGSSKFVTQFHLCGNESESYTCQGDGGGPLMMSVKNQWMQVGILSFGLWPLGTTSVYINTAKYLNWIKQNLEE